MPSFRPFRGLRYDSSLVSMDDVIAPPYDVVDSAGRAALAARSEYNAIRVELPVEDAPGGDRYQDAARLLADWEAKGVLRHDGTPAFYGYRMRSVDEIGRTLETTGVLGSLGLEDAGEGGILPHEETMPKPKGDRLFLLRATRTNLSPIWGLSMAAGLTGLCGAPPAGDPSLTTATDADGVVHDLWPITDPEAVDPIARAVASTPVVIADGHHRFETALAYHGERGGSTEGEERGSDPAAGDGGSTASGGGSSGVMAFVVELAEEQLHVRAIHRVISGLPAGTDVFDAFSGRFAPQEFTGDPGFLTTELLSEQGAIALVTREATWLLRDFSTVTGAGKGQDVLAELDSVRLRAALGDLPAHEIDYEPSWAQALSVLRGGGADAVVMIRPVSVGQIGRAAHAGLRMPPKTTFFFPKPRTGMVFRPL